MRKKPSRVETVDLPGIKLRAQMKPVAAEAEERVVDAAFYTGAEVVRVPLFDDPYLLSFSMEPKAVRLGRLNAGAPMLDSHDRYGGVSAVLGVVESGRIENGEGVATLRFSNRPELDALWQDVQDGILTNVSMGVQIYELTELGEDEDTGMSRVQATDWEPQEISMVAVGADPGAQIRLSDESHGTPCRIIHRAAAAADAPKKGNTMEKINVRLLADTDEGKRGEIIEILAADFDETLHSKDIEPKPKRAGAKPKGTASMSDTIDQRIEDDKEYKAQIKRVAAYYGMDELWVQRQVSLGVSAEEALEAATLDRARQAPVGGNDIGFGTDHDSVEFKVESMAGAVSARASGQEPDEAARRFYGMSFAELALECLSLRGRGRGLDARRDFGRIISAELALHTTSDFPLLLSNALNKLLLPEYAQAMPTYRRLAVERPFNDFRAHNFLRAGDFPNMLKVNEHGEFKYGTMGENNEPVTAATYGRIIGLSRQTLINDDLSAFSDLAGTAARRVADFENALFFSTCITPSSGLGPALSDAALVYAVGHANLTSAGALSNALLGEALALMMAQTSLDGLKLNIEPRIVLTSPTSVVLARTLLAAITPNQASQVNPFAGQMEAIGDANLSGTRFYVLADPGALPNYIYGYIGGQGPRTEVRSGFEVDGVEFKLALDFGVGAIDYRGGVTGAGA